MTATSNMAVGLGSAFGEVTVKRAPELCMTLLIAVCALAASAHSQTPQRSRAVPDPPPTALSKSPYASSLPAVASSQEPAGIAWGPGREVQAGLLLSGRNGGVDQRTGLYVFDVYIRYR